MRQPSRRQSNGDRAAGFLPAGIIASVGGTSVGGTDDVAATCAIAKRHGLYLHVDAAWAGSAMICPEFRHFWAGVEDADSIVFNPHKWLGAQFDCSVQFIREPERSGAHAGDQAGIPENATAATASSTIPNGRCRSAGGFRALKLWFLLRAHGLEGLRTMIRNHVAWSEKLACAARGGTRISRSSPSRCCRCSRSGIRLATSAIPTSTILRLVERHQRRRPHLPDADARRRPCRDPLSGRPVRDRPRPMSIRRSTQSRKSLRRF